MPLIDFRFRYKTRFSHVRGHGLKAVSQLELQMGALVVVPNTALNFVSLVQFLKKIHVKIIFQNASSFLCDLGLECTTHTAVPIFVTDSSFIRLLDVSSILDFLHMPNSAMVGFT